MDELQIRGRVKASGRHRWAQVDLDAAPADARVDDLAAVVPGRRGRGVLLRWLLDEAHPEPNAGWACLESADGSFAASLEVGDLGRAVVVHHDGEGPLDEARGGPFRVYIPGAKDACGNIKHLGQITLGDSPERDTRPPVAERTC
ncbi:molybdopterin-dependent oxidoreductase [Planctomycetota bacterium]|jgi:DMSO/TMAO reductase YedYZ molybdopterin-dependent catalytic subunit|nr:molybdopterin-dependent oxidoreductase [Planctomycetota bacterium]